MIDKERGCLSKRAYYAEVEALVVASRRTAQGAPPLKTYRCPNCGLWHLTKRRDDGEATQD
ncbi:MAG TPA: hypothetical protein VD931_22745 [Baekduia sp.]|nr:hypothetical protein [Baekduia sp.]